MGQLTRSICSVRLSIARSPNPTAIIMSKLIAVLFLTVMVATVANAGIMTCLGCFQDIEADIKACGNAATVKDRVTCAIDAMKSTADCSDCVCNVLALAFKLDASTCDKKQVRSMVPNHRIH